jgi:predicted dehydrogenase
MNRRTFLRHSATAGLSLGLAARLAPLARAATPPSPQRRLRVAVAGTNSRGLTHIQCLAAVPGVEIAYVCDVDDKALAKGLAEAAKWGQAPKGIRDFRRALEDKAVDALTIATPDHWHAPMSFLALAAGKHVFVEKPCSHNPHEGELLVAAAARHGRLVQMGNQRRSFPAMQEAITQIHAGAIGRAYFARGWYANRRGSIGRGKPAAVPATLDFDLWQGPAPRQAYRDNLIHYNWHWFWHWGTGEALNNGTHEMDIARWALGVDNPVKVTSTGGRFQFQDDWETPDTQVIGWEFPGGKSMTWEGRSCNDFPVDGRARGVMVHGTEGSMLLDGPDYTLYDRKNKVVKAMKDATPVDSTNTMSSTGVALDTLHFKNFADAIRDGVALNAPVAEANKSVTMLQLGNIAQRTGRSLRCDPATAHILDDAEAMKLWRRDYEPGWEPKA